MARDKENLKNWRKEKYKNDPIWREKINKRKDKDRKKHPERSRKYKLKKKYGMTVEEYQQKFDDQNGLCAICKRPQLEKVKSLGVDHNHFTGKVRSLLCQKCNSAIGLMEENIENIKLMGEYLENWNSIHGNINIEN